MSKSAKKNILLGITALTVMFFLTTISSVLLTKKSNCFPAFLTCTFSKTAEAIKPNLWVDQVGSGDCLTRSSPCTITRAMEKVQPGDTIQIIGTINTPFIFEKSGTKDAPITVTGGAVDTIGSTEQNAVLITGSWVIFDNVEIVHGYDFGIRANGDYVIIKNSKIHDNVTNPAYRLPNGRCDPTKDGGWGSGHRHYMGADYGQVINNEVYNNCGEGITGLMANNLEIIGNNVYDNFSVGIYIDSSQNVTIRDNITRATNPDYYRNNLPMHGIYLGEEHYDWADDVQIQNILIDNNLIEGVGGISFYSEIPNGHIEYITITNNTFKDVYDQPVYLPDLPGNIGIIIENNIVNTSKSTTP